MRRAKCLCSLIEQIPVEVLFQVCTQTHGQTRCRIQVRRLTASSGNENWIEINLHGSRPTNSIIAQ